MAASCQAADLAEVPALNPIDQLQPVLGLRLSDIIDRPTESERGIRPQPGHGNTYPLFIDKYQSIRTFLPGKSPLD
jgi:hypothetical protein